MIWYYGTQIESICYIPFITSCLFFSVGDKFLNSSGGSGSVSDSLSHDDDLLATLLTFELKFNGTEGVFSQLPLLLLPTTSKELLGLSRLLGKRSQTYSSLARFIDSAQVSKSLRIIKN